MAAPGAVPPAVAAGSARSRGPPAHVVQLKEQDKKGEFLQPGSVHDCALPRRGNEDDDQDQGRLM